MAFMHKRIHRDQKRVYRAPLVVRQRVNIRARAQGRTWTLDFSNETTVEELKELLRQQEGVPFDHQLLFQSRQLADGRTLSSCGVKDGDIVSLLAPMRPLLKEVVVQTLTGERFTVRCSEEMTVKELKAHVEEEKGIPHEQQKFIFDSRQLEDECTLRSCNVHKQSTLHLALWLPPPRKRRVYVKTTAPVMLDFTHADDATGADLKKMIYDREGIPREEQQLFFGGSELKDEETLVGCGVQSDSTRPVVLVRNESVDESVKDGDSETCDVASLPDSSLCSALSAADVDGVFFVYC